LFNFIAKRIANTVENIVYLIMNVSALNWFHYQYLNAMEIFRLCHCVAYTVNLKKRVGEARY